ncbi:MAG: response regulator transcription factor [Verrucomicrobia bacterium]|nr:response regulator transcription factor [Verrucomicrobiota bacterium]
MNSPDSNQQPQVRIVLVDDHPVVLEGYRTLLSGQAQFLVCATVGSAPAAVAAVERERPQLVLTDLTLPGRSGLDLIKDLVALDPALKILVVSMHDETLWAERALKAGARGYVMKDCDSNTVIAAVRTVLAGGIYLSAAMSSRVLVAFAAARPRGSSVSPLETLSDREFEVFRWFGEGRTAKEIAAQLSISPKTVAVHRDHIKDKLGFVTSAEMIREAVRWVAAHA